MTKDRREKVSPKAKPPGSGKRHSSPRSQRKILKREQQTQEMLRRSEERYRTLAEQSLMGLVVVQDFHIVYANAAYAKLSGYTVDELLSLPPEQAQAMVYPEDQALVCQHFCDQLAGKAVLLRYECRGIRKDGTVWWMEVHANRIEYDGKPAIQAACIDMTTYKRAEEALRQSEERYRTILDEMEEGYYEEDLAGKFTFVNDAMCRIFGYSRDELIGMHYSTYTPQEHIKTILEGYDRMYRTGQPLKWYPMVAVAKDGTQLFVEDSVFSMRNEKGEIIGFRGVSRDVTERRKAEQALKQSEERYRQLTENASEAIVVAQDGEIKYINPKGAELSGYSVEEMVSLPFAKFIHPDDMVVVADRYARRLAGEPVPQIYDFRIIRKDGHVRWGTFNAVPISWEDKPAVLCFISDITERKEMDEQLILTDRLASIGQIAAGIAHELNNPLTSVIGFSDLLLERDLPSDVIADLHTVNQEAERAVAVVKGLLAFARQQKVEKTLVNINSIIQGVLQLRSYEQRVSNIEVDARFAPSLPSVMGNVLQLQQVFVNIIINAEQAMVEAHGRGKLTIATEQDGDMVRASITDDGPGISPDNMKRLFIPFFTTREVGKGTGLGLSICHGIITEHGGKIYAASELGKGAAFVVELPASK
jgi:two-component system NtrC family sensor kinase